MNDIPDSHRDLLTAPVGVLSTVGARGVPQSTPVWFTWYEDRVRMWLSDSRQKTRNLSTRPACSFVILDLENPGRYLALRGHAELVADPDARFGKILCGKYGVDASDFLVSGETRYEVSVIPASVQVR